MAGQNYSSKHPIIQQKQTPSSNGPHHRQDNQKRPANLNMAATNDRFDSKRMTRWEPGVDFGKLVSFFGKGKKDTSPGLPQSNQHLATSPSAPAPTRNPTAGYTAANGVPSDSRDGRAGTKPSYGGQGMGQQEVAAGSSSSAYASASSGPSRNAKNAVAGRGHDERLDPRAFGPGARSPLSRNPSFHPGDQGESTSYTTASRATERSRGKAVLRGNELTNHTNTFKVDRRQNEQERGVSPAWKPVDATPTDRDAQADRRKQHQNGRGDFSDPRTTDRLLIRDNRDVRVPVPEIKVSEPNLSSERDTRGQDPRAKTQQTPGTAIAGPGRGIDERRQPHTVKSSPAQQGLGLATQKTAVPLLPPLEVIPSGQRSTNRNELVAQNMAQKVSPSKNDIKATTSFAGGLDYKLDSRTNKAPNRHEVPERRQDEDKWPAPQSAMKIFQANKSDQKPKESLRAKAQYQPQPRGAAPLAQKAQSAQQDERAEVPDSAKILT